MNKAIEVFDDLTEKTAESYNWIIRGLAQVRRVLHSCSFHDSFCLPVMQRFFV